MLQAIGFIMLLHLFLYFAWADQSMYNSSITAICVNEIVIELWSGSYRMLEQLSNSIIIDTYLSNKTFIYVINVLTEH